MFKRLVTFCAAILLVAAFPIREVSADALYLPNLGMNATGTTSGSQHLLDVNVALSPGSGSVITGGTYSLGAKGVFNVGVLNAGGSTLGTVDGTYTPMTVDGTGRLRVDATITEAATAANAGALPGVIKVVGGYDGTVVRVMKTNTSGDPQVDVVSSALPTGAATSALQTTGNTSLSSIDTKTPALVTGRVPVDGSGVTQPISAASLPLPTGASTEATLSSLNGKVTAVNTGAVVVSSSALPTGASTAAKQPSLGTAGSASTDVITVQGIAAMTALKVDGSAVTQPVSISGNQAVNLAQVAGASVGTGHGTAAGAIRVELPTDGTGVVNAAQSGTWNVTNVSGTVSLPTGAATSALQTTGNTSLSTIATNSAKAPISTTGSGSAAAATVSTVITLTHPANAVGFLLQANDANTANLRWSVGRTATATLGQQLQPGRDTGFVPAGADVSLVAESGTQTYDVQWVSQ